MKNLARIIAVLAVFSTLATTIARASVTAITVDEYGVGTWLDTSPLQYVIGPNAASGVAGPVLTYFLPHAVAPGDVQIFEVTGALSDLIRFPGDNTMIFLSDGTEGLTSPADVLAWPANIGQLGPVVNLQEQGIPEVYGFAVHTPAAGGPGFDATAPGATYLFISEVPEPTSVVIALCGGALLLGLNLWRRNHS